MNNDHFATIKDVPGACPICGENFISQCRCMISHRICPNGHKWHLEGKHRKEFIEADGRWHTVEVWIERVLD
jgi:hypothetical protein